MAKNMKSIVGNLAPIAEQMPTQSVPISSLPKKYLSETQEPMVQFSFTLRKSQRRELKRLAEESDMTARAFILDALKAKGLKVVEEDMTDLRSGK